MLGLKTPSVVLIEFESDGDDERAMDVLMDAGESYASGGTENRILVSSGAAQTLREHSIKFKIITDTSVGRATRERGQSA